ncbi:ABC transporter permease [Pseudonocardia pini]|uniref:ABC transporter permease n=1 Tax=Pseudonocardia pini TaxID=2758030 RepID=UPI0028A6138E|nr:ABC transporter permease [Pseudonocardia pini]
MLPLSALTRYLGKRILFVPFGVLAVFSLTFLLVNAIPSDPVSEIAGPTATPEQVAAIRTEIGLDAGLWERFGTALTDLVARGSLGESYYTKTPVLEDVQAYLPATIELVALSMVVAVSLGVAIGAVGAYTAGRVPDRASRTATTLLQVVPDFLLGLVLIYVLFYSLGWAPAPTGQLGLLDTAPPPVTGAVLVDAVIAGQWDTAGAALQHAALPVLTLGISSAALFAKMSRSALLKALRSPQVEFARALGLPSRTVFGYAFGAARTQIVTYSGVLFAGLVGGDVIVEQLFAWNGIGQFVAGRITQLDLPAVQGTILVLALITLAVLIVVDIVVALLDPRVSYA